MSAYKAPGIAIYQTIQRGNTAVAAEQNIALVGGAANITAYTENEKSNAYAGEYLLGEPALAVPFKRAVGDNSVDTSYTGVFLENAMLGYAEADVTVPAKKYNELIVPLSEFSSRMPQVGDAIKFSYTDGSNTKNFYSSIFAVKPVDEKHPVTGDDVLLNSTSVATINGAYSSRIPTSYVFTVKRGGSLGAAAADPDEQKPVIIVSDTAGVSSPQEIVIDDSVANYAIGNGLTVAFVGTVNVTAGEQFIYQVKPITDSTTDVTIVVRNNLPTPYANINTEATIANVAFCLVKNLQLENNLWSQNQQQVLIAEELNAATKEFEHNLPVLRADVYVRSRIWNTSLTSITLATLSDLERLVPGPIHPDNPLKYGAYKALQNAEGKEIILAVVKNPGLLDDWTAALNVLSKLKNAYAIVPLTTSTVVQQTVLNYVESESSDTINRRKECWFPIELPESVPVITYSNTTPTVAKVVDNPDRNGTEYDYVIADTPDFGVVKAGDEFRCNYSISNDGSLKYDSRIVLRVINDESLELSTPLDNEINIAARYEIWRPTNETNFEENLGIVNWTKNRRCILTWAINPNADGYAVPGYFMSAAVAAYACAVNPNVSITLKSIKGFDALNGFDQFTDRMLNALATKGVTIIAKNDESTFVRHAITSGDFTVLNEREEMSTRNFDSVSNYYNAAFGNLLGKVNATREGLTFIFDAMQKASSQLMLRYYSDALGGQIVNYYIRDVSIDPIFLDVVNVIIEIELPHMVNRIELHLQVVAETSAANTNFSTTAA